jgi:hypothetical protein
MRKSSEITIMRVNTDLNLIRMQLYTASRSEIILLILYHRYENKGRNI